MVGMRVLKIVREGKREETRTRARVPSPFPFRLPSFFFSSSILPTLYYLNPATCYSYVDLLAQ